MTEVIFRDAAGKIPSIEVFDEVKELGGHAIGRFEDGGTGFIVKLDSEILIATAAHIFVEDYEFDPSPKIFHIDHQEFNATPIKPLIDWKDPDKRLIDPISRIPLSIPEDWTLCTLTGQSSLTNTANLIALEISSFTQAIGCPVKVVGYPNKISRKNMSYHCPSAKGAEIDDLVRDACIIRKNLIFFDGNIIESGDVICANCCTVNGMSGGPLLKKEGSQYFVIGLLHGSRPSEIHYLSVNLIRESSDTILNQLLGILEHKLAETRSTIAKRKLCNSLENLKDYRLGICSLDTLKATLDSIYDDGNLIEEDAGNSVTYNVFIPSKKFTVTI